MTTKKMIQLFMVAAPVLVLNGCFETQAPECSDDAVVETVKNIYSEIPEKNKDNPIAGMFMKTLPKSITSLDSIRPISYDENIKLRTCKAQATLENQQTIDLQYTVQTMEKDPDQFYVELNTDFVQGLLMNNIMNHSGDAE